MRTLISIALIVFASLPSAASAEVIYEKNSLYRNITVTDDGDRICMQFASKGYYVSQQTCEFKAKPDELVFDYAKLVMAGLIINPHPERILIIGLGGGTLPMTLHKIVPDAKIDAIEIDPAVVDVAKRFFSFEESENVKAIERDGRVYVKQAAKFNRKYDFIILDAFNGDYIPEHLMTREWLEEVKSILTDDGVLIANTFSASRLYHNESVTYEAAFGWIRNIKLDHGNRVILSGNFDPVSRGDMIDKAGTMDADRFLQYGFTPVWVAKQVRNEADWNQEARVLTDQYSPANLLQGD